MSQSKGQLISDAYVILRISGLTTNPAPEEIKTALTTLENMMAEFYERGICSSYLFEAVPDDTTDSQLERKYNEAVTYCLASRIAGTFGKELLPTQQATKSGALSAWQASSFTVNQILPPNRQARGSGNTFRFSNRRRFYSTQTPVPNNCDTHTLLVDEVNIFDQDFNEYLKKGETITSYTTDVASNISLISSSQADGIVTMTVKGLVVGTSTIKITITTSLSRVNPHTVYFIINEVH